MKRALSAALISLLCLTPSSNAAVKKATVKSLKLLTSVSSADDFAGLLTIGKTIFIYGNHGENSYVRAVDVTGKELWNIALDPASPSIATAATVDGSGNIWIAGSTSLMRPIPAPSPTPSPLNPDNVIAPADSLKTDLNAFSLWTINPATQLATQYSLQLETPVLINSISIDKSGIIAAGTSGTLITADLSGHIAQPIHIGTSATSFESIVRNTDGSVTAVGSSSETLGGKKLVGSIDGVLVKISKVGKVLSVVRSSASKASRSWNSATTSGLLGGEVITGKKIESAITKFSMTFIPTWNYKFASSGGAFVSGSTYAFFESTSAITQLSNWSPKAPQPMLLTFDAKGVVTAGYSAPADQKQVLGLYQSSDFGLLSITSSGDTVSIFTLK